VWFLLLASGSRPASDLEEKLLVPHTQVQYLNMRKRAL